MDTNLNETPTQPALVPPVPPPASTMKQLHPKAVWIFFFRGLSIGIAPIIAFCIYGIILVPTLASKNNSIDSAFASIIFVIPIVLLIFGCILAYVWGKLSYKYYKYELREDGFRKEHGVIWKKYVTIPYERIQNVDINRGLIDRIVGLSELNIQTAGMSSGSGSYGGGAEGKLLGILPQEAEFLRDELIKRARGKKDQGL